MAKKGKNELGGVEETVRAFPSQANGSNGE